MGQNSVWGYWPR